jgi:hypothetical protein
MDNLVLKYLFRGPQGNEAPAMVTLTPDGAGLTVNFDLAGGQFTMDAQARRSRRALEAGAHDLIERYG